MPESLFISEHWKKQQKAFSDNLSSLKKKITADKIHELRVAIKKIRSYHKLILAISNKRGAESDPDTRQLFAVLGKCRELQVNLQWLGEMHRKYFAITRPVKNTLRSAWPDAEKRLKKAIAGYPFKKGPTTSDSSISHILSFTPAELITKIEAVLRESLKKIRHEIKDMDARPHPLRKELKKIFYWLSVCPPGSLLSESQLKDLDEIQNLLGEWHDQRMAGQMLKYYRREFLPAKTKEYDQYKKLERSIKRESRDMLENARAKTEKWLKHFLPE